MATQVWLRMTLVRQHNHRLKNLARATQVQKKQVLLSFGGFSGAVLLSSQQRFLPP
jgi:hypothetical protein